ncbi:MAG: T9SS type A sorting domain-containing protein [Candidatus Delongbacteria bacterium]
MYNFFYNFNFIGKNNNLIGVLDNFATTEEIDIMIKRTMSSFYDLYLKRGSDRILLTGSTYQIDLNEYFQYKDRADVEFYVRSISNNYVLETEITGDKLILSPTSVNGFSFLSVIAKVPDKDIFIETVLEVINPTELYEDFEIADLESSQISWTHAGEAQWMITEGQSFMGDRSLRSGEIGPGQESEIRIELDLQEPGTLIFAYKTSLRPYYDKLNFYIDDLNISETESPDLWTGNNDWRLMSFNIRAGKRSLRWIYNRTSTTIYYYDYTAWIDMVVIPDKFDPLSSIDDETNIIKGASLNAYPNPFNPNTTINFQIHERDIAELLIFDIKGRQVAEVFKGQLDKGMHSFEFDGSRLSSGIYYSVLKYGDKFLTNKLILAK